MPAPIQISDDRHRFVLHIATEAIPVADITMDGRRDHPVRDEGALWQFLEDRVLEDLKCGSIHRLLFCHRRIHNRAFGRTMERSVCDCTPSSLLLTVSVGSVGKSTEKLPSAFWYRFHSSVCPAIGAARQSSSNAGRARVRIFRISNCGRISGDLVTGGPHKQAGTTKPSANDAPMPN